MQSGVILYEKLNINFAESEMWIMCNVNYAPWNQAMTI